VAGDDAQAAEVEHRVLGAVLVDGAERLDTPGGHVARRVDPGRGDRLRERT
jgi:hypothetical protein